MASYSLINRDGTIINRIELDDGAEWEPPEGHIIVSDGASPMEIGGSFINDVYTPPVSEEVLVPVPTPTVLSQDLMAQFTTDDATKIQVAIASNVKFWLLWSAMQAQSEPMKVTNARFLTGWGALTQVLGSARMDAIAKALSVDIPQT